MLQIPAIKKAKEKGLYVYVLDYDSKAMGIPFADEFLCISTIDKQAVYDAALKYQPDYIITSTSDMPVQTVSWVNEKLGKNTDISYEGAICATNKAAMRQRMKQCGVPIPEFHIIYSFADFKEVVETMPDKFIVKPSDNAASRGVMLVDKTKSTSYEDLYNYCCGYSRKGEILIEEFMTGPEVSVESYTVEGVPHIITITDKLLTKAPFFVELGHTEPSRLPDDIIEEIKSVTISAICAIGMMNGPNHTELKVTPEGVKLVEIAARLGGDFITSRLVPLSTGVDMIECSFSTLLGEHVHYIPSINQGSAIRFIQGEEGVISAIEGVEKVENMPGVVEVKLYKKIGEQIQKPKNSSDRVGHIIAVGINADEAAKLSEGALEGIKVIVN